MVGNVFLKKLFCRNISGYGNNGNQEEEDRTKGRVGNSNQTEKPKPGYGNWNGNYGGMGGYNNNGENGGGPMGGMNGYGFGNQVRLNLSIYTISTRYS